MKECIIKFTSEVALWVMLIMFWGVLALFISSGVIYVYLLVRY